MAVSKALLMSCQGHHQHLNLRCKLILCYLTPLRSQSLVFFYLNCETVTETVILTFSGAPQLFWPPIFGQQSVTWDQVFALVERPEMLWECWKPSKSLDKYSLDELWACYNAGEKVFNSEGIQTGVKPPLRQVEQFFQSKWRKEGAVSRSTDKLFYLAFLFMF